MQETRRQRLKSVILEELSQIVPREVKDPRVPSITFTSCEVTPDGGQATVFFSILGAQLRAEEESFSELAEKAARERAKLCIEGLTSASGYLRRHLGKILTTRHIPTLVFREDRGFENTLRVNELLKKISDANPPAASDSASESSPSSTAGSSSGSSESSGAGA
jgi:ribosome-binding factor A